MSTPPGPQDGTQPAPGDGAASPGPAYYRPGPSSGYYPQYPQNPFGPGSSGVAPQLGGGGARPPWQEQVTYPYGGPFPAGTGPQHVGRAAGKRPGSMVVALLLLLVSPALFLLGGLTVALAPLTPDMFPPESGIEEALAGTGLTMDQLLSVLRTIGAVFAVLAVIYALLAIVSFMGKLGALVTLTVLTALFDLFLLLTLGSALANPVAAILPLIIVATSVAGVWLMFSTPVRAWFAARR